MSAATPSSLARPPKLPQASNDLLLPEQLLKATDNGRPAWWQFFDPLSGASLETLIAARNEARWGAYARQALIFNETIYCDPILPMLYAKMANGASAQKWEIVALEESEEAENDKKILEEFYSLVRNVPDAFAGLATAPMYGYAHVQLCEDEGGYFFSFIPQQFWVKPSNGSEWQFNPASVMGTNTGDDVSEEIIALLEFDFPLLYPAAHIAFERNHIKEAWDTYADRFGVPPAIIKITKEGLSQKGVNELFEAAQQIKAGASMVIPYGADAEPMKAPGISHDFFLSRINISYEETVTLWTGGLLTILAKSGSGTLAGNAHSDSWNMILNSLCDRIAESINRTVNRFVFGHGYTPKAALQINYEPVQSPEQKADVIEKLARSGLSADPEGVRENLSVDVSAQAEARSLLLSNRSLRATPSEVFDDLQKAIEENLLAEMDHGNI